MAGVSPSPIIAMTGATGFVGSHFLDLARAEGLAIRALTRTPRPDEPSVKWVTGTLDDPAALDALCDGADAMLHIAGAVNAPDIVGFKAANVDGTAHVLDAARSHNVARIVHVSSLAVREPMLSIYGWSKAEAETLVRNADLPSKIIVRPPAIYGPRDKDMFEMFRMARKGVVMLPPPGRISVIHVRDLARLLLALVMDENGGPALYEADDGRPGGWSHAEFAAALGKAMGRSVRPVHIPRWALELAAKGDRLVRGPKAKLTPDRARYLAHPDWTIIPARRPPENLWQPRIATEQGLADTALWYQEQGWF